MEMVSVIANGLNHFMLHQVMNAKMSITNVSSMYKQLMNYDKDLNWHLEFDFGMRKLCNKIVSFDRLVYFSNTSELITLMALRAACRATKAFIDTNTNDEIWKPIFETFVRPFLAYQNRGAYFEARMASKRECSVDVLRCSRSKLLKPLDMKQQAGHCNISQDRWGMGTMVTTPKSCHGMHDWLFSVRCLIAAKLKFVDAPFRCIKCGGEYKTMSAMHAHDCVTNHALECKVCNRFKHHVTPKQGWTCAARDLWWHELKHSPQAIKQTLGRDDTLSAFLNKLKDTNKHLGIKWGHHPKLVKSHQIVVTSSRRIMGSKSDLRSAYMNWICRASIMMVTKMMPSYSTRETMYLHPLQAHILLRATLSLLWAKHSSIKETLRQIIATPCLCMCASKGETVCSDKCTIMKTGRLLKIISMHVVDVPISPQVKTTIDDLIQGKNVSWACSNALMIYVTGFQVHIKNLYTELSTPEDITKWGRIALDQMDIDDLLMSIQAPQLISSSILTRVTLTNDQARQLINAVTFAQQYVGIFACKPLWEWERSSELHAAILAICTMLDNSTKRHGDIYWSECDFYMLQKLTHVITLQLDEYPYCCDHKRVILEFLEAIKSFLMISVESLTKHIQWLDMLHKYSVDPIQSMHHLPNLLGALTYVYDQQPIWKLLMYTNQDALCFGKNIDGNLYVHITESPCKQSKKRKRFDILT
jgi:hypothetical protein